MTEELASESPLLSIIAVDLRQDRNGRWERCSNEREQTGGTRREVRKWWLFPTSRDLSLHQNVQKHIGGQGFTPLREECSGW